MDFFFRYFGNFGLAILATTIVVKAPLLPARQQAVQASMANMKKMQPKMEELKAKHGDDRMAQQQAMMQLYKTEKINPIAGCWPMLMQIPVFFALYKVLLRHHRNAACAVLRLDSAICRRPIRRRCSTCSACCLMTCRTFLMIGVWPLIMGITMFLQMRMNPTPPDPTQAMIFTWMPVIFTFMLATFPAGLVIYWAWNNTLSIIQQASS
jgi:YidC/Oxa1 family membrane protein insertase